MFKLISSGELKALTKGDFGNKFDDLLDEIIIPAVGETFAYYCNRPDFDKKARTEFFSPHRDDKLIFLSSPPIAASPAVQLWQDTAIPRAYGSDTLLVNGTDYFVHEGQGVLEKLTIFPKGPLVIKVTYTGGYLTADSQGIPADLRFAAAMQASILFRDRELYGISSRSLEGGSVGFVAPTTLPKAVTMILERYKIYATAA